MPAHRYVEENGLDVMMASKRSPGVAPEVNIRESVPCTSPPSTNKAIHSVSSLNGS